MKHFSTKDAISATRGLLRSVNLKPENTTAKAALATLDDFSRKEKFLLVCIWYMNASEGQIKSFERGWEEWRAKERSNQAYNNLFK